jgi:hypothetical protein
VTPHLLATEKPASKLQAAGAMSGECRVFDAGSLYPAETVKSFKGLCSCSTHEFSIEQAFLAIYRETG